VSQNKILGELIYINVFNYAINTLYTVHDYFLNRKERNAQLHF